MRKSISNSVGLTKAIIPVPDENTIKFYIMILCSISILTLSIMEIDNVFITWAGLLAIPSLFSYIGSIYIINRKNASKALVLASGTAYFLGYVISMMTEEILSIALAYAISLFIWYYYSRIATNKRSKALLMSLFQMAINIFFFSMFYPFTLGEGTEAKIVLSAIVPMLVFFAFLMVVNAPMKRTFGYNSFEVAEMFLNQWFKGKRDLENAFGEVGEEAEIPIHIHRFKIERDSDVCVVVPYIHFGPFGNLGGSMATVKINSALEKMGLRPVVLHSTATHSLNPTTKREMNKIVEETKKALYGSKISGNKCCFVRKNEIECRADGLLFGTSAIIGLSRAPNTTEDVDFGSGLSIIERWRGRGINVSVCDQHNAETGEITFFGPNHPVSRRYFLASEKVLNSKDKEWKKLRVGFSKIHPNNMKIGGSGIRCVYFSTKPEYAMIVIDSNGITPQYREKLVEVISKKCGCLAEVYTTDTHERNAVQGVVNPIGEEDRLEQRITEMVKKAKKDSKEATAMFGERWAKIKVMGQTQPIEIVATVNSIIAIARILIPLAIATAVYGTYLIIGG